VGCINQGYAVTGDTGTYFVKLNQATQLAMFEAEAQGLQQMLETDTIRFPNPFAGAQQLGRPIWSWWLGGPWGDPILENGALSGSNALTHQQQSFGWKQNNTIGSTPKSIPGQQTG